MSWEVLEGDCRDVLPTLPAQSVHTVITSPPYFGLRDYGNDGQIGLEPTPDEFVQALVEVFREVRRVLRDDGTVWLVLGDSYSGPPKGSADNGTSTLTPHASEASRVYQRTAHPPGVGRSVDGVKPKDLIGIPWMVAFALRADGWYLRSDIIWAKPNPMPESVTDRPTKAHEYVFLLSKLPRYFYDADAIREGSAHPHLEGRLQKVAYHDESAMRNDGDRVVQRTADRNKRTVWHVPEEVWGQFLAWLGSQPPGSIVDLWRVATQPFAGTHFAAFPEKLIEPCILAGCPEGGTVLDPFVGAGTTGLVALRERRNFIGIELSADYAEMARDRIAQAERLGFRSPEKGPQVSDDQASLFGVG